MLTEFERKQIAKIPFIARRRRRLTFVPIVIAFCAMATLLCLLGLCFHSTLPDSDVRTSGALPPKSSEPICQIANDVETSSPFLSP